MERTLGPRNVGDILKETFAIYGKNFWRLASIVASVQVPLIIVVVIIVFAVMMPIFSQLGSETFFPTLSQLYPLVPAYIVLLLVSLVAGVLLQGAIIHAVSEQYFQHPINIGRAFRFSWQRMPNMLGAVLLVGVAVAGILLIAIGIPVAIYFTKIITVDYRQLIIMGIALVAIVYPAVVYLSVMWAFAIYTALLEGCGPTSALSRSMALVKGSWWRVLGITILLTLIVFAINFVIGFVPILGALVAAILSPPITAIGITLLYFDLRVRKEGYNLDALANELGLASTPTDAAPNPQI